MHCGRYLSATILIPFHRNLRSVVSTAAALFASSNLAEFPHSSLSAFILLSSYRLMLRIFICDCASTLFVALFL